MLMHFRLSQLSFISDKIVEISHSDEILTEGEIFTLYRDPWNCTNIYFDPLEKNDIQNVITRCLFLSSIFITIIDRLAPFPPLQHTQRTGYFFLKFFSTYTILFKSWYYDESNLMSTVIMKVYDVILMHIYTKQY